MARPRISLARMFFKKEHKMSKNDLAQIKTVEIGSEIFVTKFARCPGSNEIDIEYVGVVWKNKKEEPWIVFGRDSKGNVMATNRRGNQKKHTWVNVPEKIFDLMRLAARDHFHWHESLNIKVWNEIIYPSLLPPGKGKTKFQPAKNPGGLTAERPEPDLFVDQESIQDAESARLYRRYHGPRKSDHSLHGLTSGKKTTRPRRGKDYDQMEDQGQETLPLDDPLNF